MRRNPDLENGGPAGLLVQTPGVSVFRQLALFEPEALKLMNDIFQSENIWYQKDADEVLR